MATEEAIHNARRALPHLVLNAQRRQTLTYGELAERIGKHFRAVPWLLGYIRDEMCAPDGVPKLTVIVVNKGTQLPGESFLEEGTSHLTPAAYRQRFEHELQRVYDYSDWDDFLRRHNLRPLVSNRLDDQN